MQRISVVAIAFVSALSGAAAGTFLTYRALAPEAPAASGERPAAEEGEPRASDERPETARIAALERAVSRLNQSALRAAFAAPSGSSPAAPRQGETAMAEGDPVVDNPVFEAAVLDVIDRLEQEREVDRELERTERREQMAAQWATELASELRLSDAQEQKMKDIARRFYERMRELRGGDAGVPPSRQAFREGMMRVRTEIELEINGVLDPAQLSSYRELDDGRKLGGRFGRRSEGRAERGGRGN